MFIYYILYSKNEKKNKIVWLRSQVGKNQIIIIRIQLLTFFQRPFFLLRQVVRLIPEYMYPKNSLTQLSILYDMGCTRFDLDLVVHIQHHMEYSLLLHGTSLCHWCSSHTASNLKKFIEIHKYEHVSYHNSYLRVLATEFLKSSKGIL